MKNGLEQAIQVAGSQKKLAQHLGVTQQYISNCVLRGYLPVKRAVEIEKKLGVDRFDLINPEIAKALRPTS